jgi:hypothetical protein
MTSGTLAYSFGLGKAVVSTPYWHARELLADGRGILVPFGDATAIGSEIAALLAGDARRQAMCKRAYASSRSMTWERIAERYLAAFESGRRVHRLGVIARRLDQGVPSRGSHAPPEKRIGHLPSMCDDTGLFQHAVHSVPDRSHGYCVDDNARALLLACALNSPSEEGLPEALTARVPSRGSHAPPEMRIGHLLSMCDDTGLFQHAVHSVPDRSHGYCVDDNARALLLACALNSPSEEGLPEALTARLAGFVQHAWNPDTRRFRNFMSFDRRWLEDSGSEDSHARTLWALGECARSDANSSRRLWSASLFAEALPAVEAFRSPRAWGFTLLGLDAYCAVAADPFAERVRLLLADKLISIMSAAETQEWVWFEDGLAYDNARLPQSLIVTGISTGVPTYVEAGLRSLRWLMTLQTALSGFFRPIGTDSFGGKRKPPQAFDQQPLEATATISACLAAWRADGNPEWRAGAARAFAWFLGSNDLSMPLVDLETGGCRDGLHCDRPNENRGGESVVSYLLSLAEIRQLARTSGNRANLTPFRALRARIS